MKNVFLSLLLSAGTMFLPAVTLSLSAGEDAPADKKSQLPAQAEDWVAGPSADWCIHYDAALAKAAEENKKVYVLCTGSDWCPWCIKLRKEVLVNPEFKSFAKENLVLLYLDFPKKSLPSEQQQHNDMVKAMLKFEEGVPTAKVLDEKGRVIAEKSGYADLNAYLDFLQKAVSK